MDVSYELYKVFYYVAKSLSFSDAASELFISQSAVSQSIKQLEHRLGQVLFIRSTKHVRLTPEGEMLLKHVEPAIQLITRGENQLTRDFSRGGMQVRIAASDTICRYILVPYLKMLHESFPEVHISIINGTSLACAELLEAGQVDLIVVNSPNSALSDKLSIANVRTFRDVFIGNPKHFPECFTDNGEPREPLTAKELLALPILMLSRNSTTSQFLHEQFQKQSLELVPSIELTSNDLLIDLAKIGIGIALVPDYTVPEDTEELLVLPSVPFLPPRRLVAAFDEKWPLNEAASFFLRLLTGEEAESVKE